MRREEAIKFISENRGAFIILGDKIKELDTLKGVETLKELQSRKKAMIIIKEWLQELWNIAYMEDLPTSETEDDIFRIIDKTPARDFE